MTSGENAIFMDTYGWKPPPGGSVPQSMNDLSLVSVRANLGYARALASRLDLAALRPRPELSSSGYCLAKFAAGSSQIVAYLAGARTVELDLTGAVGSLAVEWLNLSNGDLRPGAQVAGGAKVRLASPIRGDAVVFVHH